MDDSPIKAKDVKCVRTEHRRARAEQLAGIVPDESTCPMVYLRTGDSDSARPKIVIDDVFPPALPWKVVFQDARVCCWHHHLNIQSLSFWMIISQSLQFIDLIGGPNV